VLGARILRHADRSRGRFRSFLVKALSNYASTMLARDERVRALGLDEATLESLASEAEVVRFDREWARLVVGDALDLMEADCRERGREDLWEIFRLRVAAPILEGSEPLAYEDLVARFGIATPRQAINLLATGKRAFARALRVALRRYVTSEAELEEELAELRRIVAQAG
jgi:hypothetical protein